MKVNDWQIVDYRSIGITANTVTFKIFGFETRRHGNADIISMAFGGGPANPMRQYTQMDVRRNGSTYSLPTIQLANKLKFK